MSETKLKPCPFCGCKNIQFWETDNDTHRFQIVCMQCFNGTDECISEEVAIEKWNTRKPMANIVEKLEEKTEFLKDCTKYGNENAEQQEKSYSTMMMYEVADLVDDLIDIVKQEINNGLE